MHCKSLVIKASAKYINVAIMNMCCMCVFCVPVVNSSGDQASHAASDHQGAAGPA